MAHLQVMQLNHVYIDRIRKMYEDLCIYMCISTYRWCAYVFYDSVYMNAYKCLCDLLACEA